MWRLIAFMVEADPRCPSKCSFCRVGTLVELPTFRQVAETTEIRNYDMNKSNEIDFIHKVRGSFYP